MSKRIAAAILTAFFLFAGSGVFAQSAAALRAYVGLVNQSYHPGLVEYLEKVKARLQKKGYPESAKAVDEVLKGKGGSGFVYVDSRGANYIITNYHVVTQSYLLSITFEAVDGTRTKYEGLKLIAADEENDMALLAFPEGEKPFREGLSFGKRGAEEGETVFSAGFPGLINTQLWQFGQGIVSNAFVRIPNPEDTDKLMGPYIQHTAQVDPGNSGGPLLVAEKSAPNGYAVVGINTLSFRTRQAGNYSIPASQVENFLTQALQGASANEAALRKRLDEFVKTAQTVNPAGSPTFPALKKFISSQCTAQNTEYALEALFSRADRAFTGKVMKSFAQDPVDGMEEAVAWLIEDVLRGKAKAKALKVSLTGLTRVSPNSEEAYTVSLDTGSGQIDSVWVMEYGLWKIESFGPQVKGDKSLVAVEADPGLRSDYSALISADYIYIVDRGSAVGGTLRYKGEGSYTSLGMGYFYGGKDFRQIQMSWGITVPISFSTFAFAPFAEVNAGVIMKKNEEKLTSYDEDTTWVAGAGFQGGIRCTSSAFPGVYISAAFQYNGHSDRNSPKKPHKQLITAGLGYAF
ncbi:MAG: serine protease [Spirochaetales bacterium]|jgi:serine protease Do|nr:serine protease [Spirochaetales bacterium]